MHRPVIAVAAALVFFTRFFAEAQEDAPQKAPPSTVYFAQDYDAMDQLEEKPGVTRRMVDQVVMAATHETDIVRAWRSLVSPNDKVGIKIAATGGHYFATHHGVVDAIAAGLQAAGVSRVIVWDRDADDLAAAGFVSRRGFYEVRSTPTGIGYDRKAPFSAPILGKLIWGDTVFQEKQRKIGKASFEADQLSSISYFSNILTQDVTKIINVPVFSDSPGCGVGGAVYNLTVPNLDNWRRFVQPDGAPSLPDIYADDHIRPKVVINIMDALLAQYAGGPRFNPNYSFALNRIYASKDPVALDANVFRLIQKWRVEARLPSIAKEAEWLSDAEEMGLGNFAEPKITLQQVSAR